MTNKDIRNRYQTHSIHRDNWILNSFELDAIQEATRKDERERVINKCIEIVDGYKRVHDHLPENRRHNNLVDSIKIALNSLKDNHQ